MSSHWRSSRWSSAREREEQERARAEEKSQTRRGDTSKNRKSEPAAEARTEPVSTELSDLIAASARKPREKKWPYPEEEKPKDVAPPTEPKPMRARRRRKADVQAEVSGGGPRLPNLPDEPIDAAGGSRGNRPNRPLIFGLLLFVAMGVIAFNPGDIFPSIGGDDDDPTPTEQSMILPTSVNTQPPDQTNPESTQAGGTTSQPRATRPETVCIDAGHGGWDTGFTRPPSERAPFLEEAAVNLAVSYMLKERLEIEGFAVVLTRPSGSAVNIFNQDVNGDGKVASDVDRGSDDQDGNRDELQARINICNAAQADILISLHINGYTDTTARGFEVIYTAEREFGQNNADLAFDVYSSLAGAYAEVGFVTDDRGVKKDSAMGDTQMHEGRSEDHYVMTGPAVNAADFSIVPSAMPGIICEAGFISNDADAAFFADPANLEVIANAYADGIIQYFNRYPGKFQPPA